MEHALDLTTHPVGFASIAVFVIAYGFVMAEEFLHMRKSKVVLVAAGIIWMMVAGVYSSHGDHHTAEHAVRHNLVEYAELFLFLLAAMTFINTMEERRVFDAVRAAIINRRLKLRAVFWVTGTISFFLSPIADNLTTALIMGAVVMSVGAGNKRFIGMACVNVVVAANAGGAFSPFGDITTLMVWQKGTLGFFEFFRLFLPALVNWLVPAVIMGFFLDSGEPEGEEETVEMLPGGVVVIALFLGTIATAVIFHSVFHLPPVLGMMTGLGVLKLFGWVLKKRSMRDGHALPSDNVFEAFTHEGARGEEYDIFKRLEKAEWDTLMFFYGVILCVGGLGTIGYLEAIAHTAYGDAVGPTIANIGVGVLSAIVDNIPVMFAVLSMEPAMNDGQWLLVTLTAGVGGSLLSIGSAAGVALMGQARGYYTFFVHLRWSWAIAIGYAASIGVHFLVNRGTFAAG
jgi:Na+/H+ antiporter NhaD/arsenite permease-like protein